MSIASVRLAFLSILVVAATTASTQAQWTVTDLHPAGAVYRSKVFATSGSRQAGAARVVGDDHASLWSGTAASWVDLNPVGATQSWISAIDSGQQVGVAALGTFPHAALWNGSAASFVNLHPAGASLSYASAANGGRQVGYAVVGGADHASLWSGSADSWVDLHPAAALASYASAIEGSQQGGSVSFVFGQRRASLWSGSASSWMDLHPVVALSSQINAMDDGRQGGAAFFPNNSSVPPYVNVHASLWTGTAESWVDLNPPGAVRSELLAMHGEYQAGYTVYPASLGITRAGIWRGTADSWEDLSIALPSPENWGNTSATSVWSDGVTLFVAGHGDSFVTGRIQALLWTRPLVQCGNADFNGDGDFGTDADIEAFFNCLAGNCCATCYSGGSDFNADGDSGTDADIESFFRVLAGGVC